MLKYLILGVGLGQTDAIQPGPLQAFLISRVSAHGWRRTLPASLAPLLSDRPIALVGLLFLPQRTEVAFSYLQAAGGEVPGRSPPNPQDFASQNVRRTYR